jgi:glycosyltransferase involved in cell wall biosynthesis
MHTSLPFDLGAGRRAARQARAALYCERVSTKALFLNQGRAMRVSAQGHGSVERILATFMPASIDAEFVTLRGYGDWERRILLRRVPLLPDGGWKTYRWYDVRSRTAARLLRHRLRERPLDVVHLTSNDIALRLGSVAAQVPCVTSVDVTMEEWLRMMRGIAQPSPLPKPLQPIVRAERDALRISPLTIGWTEHITRGLLAEWPAARVETLHPGLDVSLFHPRSGTRTPGPLRLLFVGGRFHVKGGPAVVEAAQRLGSAVELHVVTPDEVTPAPGVTLHRATAGTSALADLFRMADVLVLPTTVDAAPWVILEAMATGLPVVASDISSIPELVGPDAGLLVPPGRPEALVAALRRLTDDPQRLRSMGEAARCRVEDHFDARVNTERLAALLETVAR